MILKGTDNQIVEFKIDGYQFPNAKKGSGDEDWLNVFIDVQSNMGNWHTVDPSLTILEFRDLVQWFRDLSLDKKVDYPELYFTEPNLEFDLIKDENGIKHIKMIFEAESKPKSAEDGKEYFMEFQFSNSELSKIADELESEIK